MQTLRELFHPDIVWHAPGRSRLAGDHQGVDAVLGFFGRTMELTGGAFRVEVHDVLASHGSLITSCLVGLFGEIWLTAMRSRTCW
jgi:uncharacterized protein